MANRPSVNRFQRAKSEMSNSRISVSSIRTEFRNSFLNRLRSNRSKSVDRFRQIVENYGDKIQYNSIQDLRATLLLDREAATLLTSDELNDILNQIEKELAQVNIQQLGEDYVKHNNIEVEDIINRHLNLCHVCNKHNEQGNICISCSSLIHSEFE